MFVCVHAATDATARPARPTSCRGGARAPIGFWSAQQSLRGSWEQHSTRRHASNCMRIAD